MKNLLPLCAVILFVIHTEAQPLRVNNNPNVDAPYTTVQAAIDAANTGDTIFVEPSNTTYGSAIIDKQLVILGSGYFKEENNIQTADQRPSLVGSVNIGDSNGNTDASGTIIYGMHTGTINAYNNFLLRNNYIQGNVILVRSDCSGSSIVKNYITSTLAGQTGSNQSTDVIIRNNIIGGIINDLIRPIMENNTFNSTVGSVLSGHVSPVVRSNIFRSGNPFNSSIENLNQSFNVIAFDAGEFVDADALDAGYQLIETSSAKTAGFNGTEAGAFGGSDPYILSGLPPIPTIFGVQVPSSGSAESGLQVQLQIKSNN